jgi:hypothetical protein
MREVSHASFPGDVRLRLRDRIRFLLFGAAYRKRFAERARQHGIILPIPKTTGTARLTAQAAAFAIVLWIGWLGGQIHENRVRPRSAAPEFVAPQRESARSRADAPPHNIEVQNSHERAAADRKLTERSRAELEKARAGTRDLEAQLSNARSELDDLRAQLSVARLNDARRQDQLRDNEERLQAMGDQVRRLETGRAEDALAIASHKRRLLDVNERLRTQGETIERERKLLVADLDIRELMGARSLHIVDVFDVDGKGKTRSPFGRIFYTQGKSLLFYAFDLKSGGTFQAWGQRETRDESAQSLGIFYVDDQKQNRWVLKFEDPKVLAEINAVFVTVEPPGGSTKPNRQKMLYAYLNATPNHP